MQTSELVEFIRDLSPNGPEDSTFIVYDGDCPFCSNFADYMKLKDKYGALHLVDARRSAQVRALCHASGFNLDKGFLVISNGVVNFGADGMRHLAALPWIEGIASKCMKTIFGKGRSGDIAYTVLAFSRQVVLRILGRSRLTERLR